MSATYHIEGMHCGSCVSKVTAALEATPGVERARVTLDPPRAAVDADPSVSLAALQAAVRSAGSYRLTADASPTVKLSVLDAAAPDHTAAEPGSLYPLVLIVAYLVGVVALVAIAADERSPMVLMRYFMGGFFLTFSFFKLLDLRGFADAFRMYDPLAQHIPPWSHAYPFAELALGAAYIVGAWPIATNIVTLVLMLIGAAGVLRALLAKRAIRCACLGTALNLPMTTVTLVEDLTMAAMAGLMLLWH